MSLLNRGTETVKVFQAVHTPDIDSDGNKITRAAKVATLVHAVVQPISSTENADGGFSTVSRYRLRLINYPNILGAQSHIEWCGKRFLHRRGRNDLQREPPNGARRLPDGASLSLMR